MAWILGRGARVAAAGRKAHCPRACLPPPRLDSCLWRGIPYLRQSGLLPAVAKFHLLRSAWFAMFSALWYDVLARVGIALLLPILSHYIWHTAHSYGSGNHRLGH